MPLLPPGLYRKTRGIIRAGTRAAQPDADTVLEGTIYYVTDELLLERSNGSAWEEYSITGEANNISYAAGNFTANGGGTWTVDSGDIESYSYIRIGRTILFQYGINTSTVSGSPTQLKIQVPFTIAITANAIGRYFDLAAVTGGPMSAVAVSGGDDILLIKLDGTAWPNITNQLYAFGEIAFTI